MEESEIDDWFNEQKEKLEEKVYLIMNAQPRNEAKMAKAKEQFDKEYRALILQLQQKHEKLYDQKLRSAKLKAPFVRLSERWSLFLVQVKRWFTEKHLAIKKWLFDRKIKRILRDKSNL
jgi:hypothetical protein